MATKNCQWNLGETVDDIAFSVGAPTAKAVAVQWDHGAADSEIELDLGDEPGDVVVTVGNVFPDHVCAIYYDDTKPKAETIVLVETAIAQSASRVMDTIDGTQSHTGLDVLNGLEICKARLILELEPVAA